MSMFGVAVQRTAPPGRTGLRLQEASVNLRDQGGLGAVAMSIIHDLRNPLSAIHSAAEMLNDSDLPDHQVRRLARNMYSASVRIQEMLQEYADRCRANVNQPRPSSLRSLITHAIDRIAPLADGQSVIVVQDLTADVVVNADQGAIRSVLANLLVNALEAMPDGGLIHISTTVQEGLVITTVLDTGPGVAPEIRDCLFEPFVTARKAGGWGMGLAHARQVVIEHGGDMWLDSPAEGGACLSFSLPVRQHMTAA